MMREPVKQRFSLKIKRTAQRDLAALHPRVRKAVDQRILALAGDPKPRGAIPMKGEWQGFWRVRAGDHRIVYLIDEAAHEVIVAHVRPRGRVYV
jgi:mRNA interferase RelE/StbE